MPEHWIPFVPVHVPGDNRETQLQRAAMPRLIEGDPNPPVRIRPRTTLLREGLDRAAGRILCAARRRGAARRHAGDGGISAHALARRARAVWLAAHRETGRGEGSSGLAFDLIVPTA